MKRLWYWLFPLMIALAACSSSAGDPNALIEGDAQNVAPQATQPSSAVVEDSATTSSDEGAAETAVDSTGSGDGILGTDPTAVRDRDWALGAVEPALTVIEYGDFQ